MTSGCTRAQSFLPKLQLPVSLSLELSLVPCYDADWRPLVCFGPTNRRSKNIRSRSFRSAMPETSFALAFIESLAKLATALPFFMFIPTLSFLHIFLFPVTSETASRSLSRGWRCSTVSRATLFCRSSPTETGQSPRSPMSILTCCGRQEQVKLAMDVVERKEAKRRARMTPGKIELQRAKTWRLEQTKEGRCLTLARWYVGMNVKIVNVQSFFPIFSLAGHFFYFKQGGSQWKRYFCFRLRGWSANATRLHWSSCQYRYLSNWLDDDVPCTPAHQTGNTAQAWPLHLCCIRVLLIEDFLLSNIKKTKDAHRFR